MAARAFGIVPMVAVGSNWNLVEFLLSWRDLMVLVNHESRCFFILHSGSL